MADQGKWFKLWCSALDDAALEDLELSDWSRWARFGAYIKSHGNAGEIEIKSPCRSIQNLWRVKSYREIITVLVRLPNLMISTGPIQWPHGKLRPPTCEGQILCGKWCTDGRGTNWQSAVVDTPLEEVVNLWETKRSLFVSFLNWHKYQDDLSRDRVVKLRHCVTVQEEKRSRREEKRQEDLPPSSIPLEIPDVLKDLPLYRQDAALCAKLPLLWDEWVHAYPNVNLTAELAKAHAWERANRIKKRRIRFLANWFTTAQDGFRGGTHANTSFKSSRPANAFVATAGEASKYD